MSPTARIMERRQIDALILSDPVDLLFKRKTQIPTGDGGFRWSTPTTLKKSGLDWYQQAFFTPFKRRMVDFLVNTELGDVPDLPYILLGRPDLDVEPLDIFTHRGNEFQVITVDFKTSVRKACQVDYFGGQPR